jgi:hypothetical protein
MKHLSRKLKKLLSPTDVLEYVLLWILKRKEQVDDRFYTIHRRPKKASVMKAPIPAVPIDLPKTAIVMQGLLVLKDDFTLETVKLYRKYFPRADIIVSTHNDQDQHTVDSLKSLGCHVIQLPRLEFPGFHNINAQLATSYAGMEKAKEIGATYAIKTRTDQRVYNPHALQLLFLLDTAYPPSDPHKQTRRLLVPNIGTGKYRLYGIGDMFMFGHIDDQLRYWGARHDDRKLVLAPNITVTEKGKVRVTEAYLMTEYLASLGYSIDWTLENSWKAYGDYFCVFDHALLDIFWYKYDSYTEFRFHYYTMNHVHEPMQFAEWLACYQGLYTEGVLPAVGNIVDGASIEKPDQPKFTE